MKPPILTRIDPHSPTLHEVIEKHGEFYLRPYFADPDGDRQVTEAEAEEWLQTVSSIGGIVYERGRGA